MTRKGGSYTKEKDGTRKRVQYTRPAGEKEQAPKVPTVKKREVSTNEDA